MYRNGCSATPNFSFIHKASSTILGISMVYPFHDNKKYLELVSLVKGRLSEPNENSIDSLCNLLSNINYDETVCMSMTDFQDFIKSIRQYSMLAKVQIGIPTHVFGRRIYYNQDKVYLISSCEYCHRPFVEDKYHPMTCSNCGGSIVPGVMAEG